HTPRQRIRRRHFDGLLQKRHSGGGPAHGNEGRSKAQQRRRHVGLGNQSLTKFFFSSGKVPELVLACTQTQQKGGFGGHLLHKPAVLRFGFRNAAGIEELIRGSEVRRLQQRQENQAFQHKLGSITEPSGGSSESRIGITFSRAQFSPKYGDGSL